MGMRLKAVTNNKPTEKPTATLDSLGHSMLLLLRRNGKQQLVPASHQRLRQSFDYKMILSCLPQLLLLLYSPLLFYSLQVRLQIARNRDVYNMNQIISQHMYGVVSYPTL